MKMKFKKMEERINGKKWKKKETNFKNKKMNTRKCKTKERAYVR